MYKNLEYTSTTEMTREEWLEARKKGIGGSDASAVLGLNQWKSPYSLWADKLGLADPNPDSEMLRQGRDLEEYVARRFTEKTGKKVRKKNAIVKNPMYPFAIADVDRLVVGEDAILEIKTTSELNIKRYKSGEYPEAYYVQMVHYMAVCGASKVYLAVLVLGKDFMVFELERDEDEIRALMEAERNFWESYVVTQTPPPVDGSDATRNALNSVYDHPYSGGLLATTDISRTLTELEYLKAQKKSLDEEIQLKENTIKDFMGDNETLTGDSIIVTWKSQTRNSFDSKSYIADHPDEDFSKYYKSTSSRVLRMIKPKAKEASE